MPLAPRQIDIVNLCYFKENSDGFSCKPNRVRHNPRLEPVGPSSVSSPGVLRGREVAVWRGERCLLEGLDFELCSNQLALVTGPNGSGKTTLLRVIAGLAPPTSGSITWDGVAIESLPPDQRAAIAYRGHLEGLKKDLTVRENLEFHAALWGEQATPLVSLLAEVKLEHAAEIRGRYLSAGQRRRAVLATLKLSAARLWVLDEPLTNLDAEGRALIVTWIARHLSAGGSAVIATHQPEEFITPPGSVQIEL
jgi:heme exporter protein A